MNNILVTLQIFIVLILILLIFMQKSNDEGVANLTSSSGGGAKGRPVSGLGKLTVIIAFVFMANSLALAKLGHNELKSTRNIVKDIASDFDILDSESKDSGSNADVVDKNKDKTKTKTESDNKAASGQKNQSIKIQGGSVDDDSDVVSSLFGAVDSLEKTEGRNASKKNVSKKDSNTGGNKK